MRLLHTRHAGFGARYSSSFLTGCGRNPNPSGTEWHPADTGYVGIVRAVKFSLDLPPVPEPDAATETAIEPAEEEPVPMRVNVTLPDNAIRLTQNIVIAQPATGRMAVFRDIETLPPACRARGWRLRHGWLTLLAVLA